jgi:chemotaxis response regulator CheB
MTREMSSKSSAKKSKPVPGAAHRAAGRGKTAGSGSTLTPGDRLPIVGLGASAGGLEALKGFFGAMPAKTGLSFVVVVHLDPTHESLMPELLAKSTTLGVHQAQDRQPLEADHVYIIPPNRALTIDQGLIRVREVADRRGLRGSIDHFFGHWPTISTSAPSASSFPEPARKAH